MRMLPGFSNDKRFGIAIGFALCLLLCIGFIAIEVANANRKREETRASGIASVSGGIIEHIAFDRVRPEIYTVQSPAFDLMQDQATDRKLVKNATLHLWVREPKASAASIRSLAEQRGGFITQETFTSEVNNHELKLQLRVPSSQFDAALAGIESSAVKVESRETKVNDVARQYTDHGLKIRLLEEETKQYTRLLASSRSVKDVLAVRERLDAVVQELESEKGELRHLSLEADYSTIQVSLRSESQPSQRVWNFRNTVKQAFENGTSAVAEWASVVIAAFFYLPALFLWVCSIVLGFGLTYLLYRKLNHVFSAEQIQL